MRISRSEFLRIGGAAAASLVVRPFSLAAETTGDTFHFALIADSHIIDDLYKGSQGHTEDDESMFKTTERLVAARDVINVLRPKMDRVFVIGDYFHNYPSPDIDFYFQNETRVDRAKAITDKFEMPVHVGFGNHDYSIPRISREMSHELFRRKLGVQPYYSLEYRGWKFVHLNNFIGDTMDNGHAEFDTSLGSLGEEQLNWFEAELRQYKPTFVFIHFPLSEVKPVELKDYGLHTILKQHPDTIQRVVSGHWHRWFDFARTYGPQHLVMASTRYSADAYLIVEANTRTASHQLMNIDGVEWNTHYSAPYQAFEERSRRL